MAHSYLLSVVVGALSYVAYSHITLYLTRRRFKKENGCVPCPRVFNRDPILGIDVIKIQSCNSKNRIVLQENKKRFERLGNTFHTRIVTSPGR